jgi:FkbM family methyltransferase
MKLRYRIADALGYRLVKKKRDHSHIESHIPKVLESLGIDCVVDAGANRGQYAAMLRRLGYAGRIVSFEPVPAVYEELERRAKGDPDWRTHRLALGSVDENRLMHVYEATELSSLLSTSDYGRAAMKRKADDEVSLEVPVRRLDGLWDRIVGDMPDPRVFLKMDTQGCDLEVFDGASGCIEIVRGLQSELSVLPLYEGMPDYATSLQRYRSCGFEVSGFFPVFRDKQTHLLGEFDCVMIRPLAGSAAATRR